MVHMHILNHGSSILVAEVCDVLHTIWVFCSSFRSEFWRKHKIKWNKKRDGNARSLNIVWQVQLCHQLVGSARNCCYIMHVVIDRNITRWQVTARTETCSFIQLSLSHELSKLLSSSKQSTTRTCALEQTALWMRTTADHTDNPRKSRTLHHCDISYFSVHLCHQHHRLTDSNGPAEVTSTHTDLRNSDSVNFLLTEFYMTFFLTSFIF